VVGINACKVVSSPLLDLDHQVEHAPHFSDWRRHDSLSWVEMMMEGGQKKRRNAEEKLLYPSYVYV